MSPLTMAASTTKYAQSDSSGFRRTLTLIGTSAAATLLVSTKPDVLSFRDQFALHNGGSAECLCPHTDCEQRSSCSYTSIHIVTKGAALEQYSNRGRVCTPQLPP